jgi:hypothetical protein
MPRLCERLAQHNNQFKSFPASTGQDSCRRAARIVDIDQERDLLRKDRALAETAALLVLSTYFRQLTGHKRPAS